MLGQGSQGQFQSLKEGRWITLSSDLPTGLVHFASVGQQKYLRQVREWVTASIDQDWRGYADLVTQESGGADPLGKICRLPMWWLRVCSDRRPCFPLCVDSTTVIDLTGDAPVPKPVDRMANTKLYLLQKFPSLRSVVDKWRDSHDAERDEDSSVSFNDTFATFNALLA
eukprot:9049358-Karenia_brevis.AAC.1